MFEAAGAGDKRIYIVPSRDLVIARHGGPAGTDAGEALTTFDRGFWPLMARAIG